MTRGDINYILKFEFKLFSKICLILWDWERVKDSSQNDQKSIGQCNIKLFRCFKKARPIWSEISILFMSFHLTMQQLLQKEIRSWYSPRTKVVDRVLCLIILNEIKVESYHKWKSSSTYAQITFLIKQIWQEKNMFYLD